MIIKLKQPFEKRKIETKIFKQTPNQNLKNFFKEKFKEIWIGGSWLWL